MSKHLDDLKAEAERLEGEIFTREQRIYVRLRRSRGEPTKRQSETRPHGV